jgi:hypothetical protein
VVTAVTPLRDLRTVLNARVAAAVFRDDSMGYIVGLVVLGMLLFEGISHFIQDNLSSKHLG